MNNKDILFKKIIENIDKIITDDFYNDKQNLLEVKKCIKKWQQEFELRKVLTTISVSDLKFIDIEISSLFDMYISVEPVEKNFVERLSYDFSLLKKIWKEEIGGEK